MFLTPLKNLLLPLAPRPIRILRGPFRGAVIHMSLRNNVRKVLGVYEHEFNPWLEAVLPLVDTVLDVGANDGYFTFGCAAAFRRLGKQAEIFAFEPLEDHCEELESSKRLQPSDSGVTITVMHALVGAVVAPGMTTLDALAASLSRERPVEGRRTLVKIDVEGAEVEVLGGASKWLQPENYFLVEIHSEANLSTLRTRFAEAGLIIEEHEERALPMLGKEHRAKQNWWLVSPLPQERRGLANDGSRSK